MIELASVGLSHRFWWNGFLRHLSSKHPVSNILIPFLFFQVSLCFKNLAALMLSHPHDSCSSAEMYAFLMLIIFLLLQLLLFSPAFHQLNIFTSLLVPQIFFSITLTIDWVWVVTSKHDTVWRYPRWNSLCQIN